MRVIAHRGASGELPEHTLPAYELALAQGADGVECDIRLTRDNHLICVHDRTVDRVSDGTGAVSTMTLAQLRELDFGGGARVLELATLLELVRDNDGVEVFVETKHPTRRAGAVERELAVTLSRFGLHEDPRVHVISFSPLSLARAGRRLPRLDRILLWPAGRGGAARMVSPLARPTAVGPEVGDLRRDADVLGRWGRPAYTWTADERSEVQLALARGVSWMATNFPARARTVIEQSVRGAG